MDTEQRAQERSEAERPAEGGAPAGFARRGGRARALPVTRAYLGALLAAVVVRSLHLIEQPSFPAFHQPEVDAWYYHVMAQRMAAGDWLLAGETPRMSPGYGYFLGLVYALFGAGPWAIRVVQIVLGLGAVGLITDAARRLFGARWALLPAWVGALYGPYVYFEGHLLPATLGAFLHALVLWGGVVLAREPPARPGRWLALGLAWGVCCVVRPNGLVLIAPLLLLCFEVLRRRGPRIWGGAAAALVLGGVLGIAPLTARNYAATGELIPITAHGGVNFYVGNGPGATGTWHMPKELPGSHSPAAQFEIFHREAERALGHALGPREADAYWMRRTARAAAEDPGRWLGLMLRKLHLFWNGRELHNIYDYEFWRVIGTVLGAPLVQFAWVAPFGLVGTLLMLFAAPERRFVALFNLSACAAVVLVFVTDRYRLPAVGGIVLAGTALVREAVERWRRREWRHLGAGAVALAVAVAIAVPVPVHKRFEEKYTKLGNAWLQLGELAYAEWAYRHAIEADPDYLPARERLATVYERGGDAASARRELLELERRAEAAGRPDLAARARQRRERLPAPARAPPGAGGE